MVGRHLAQGLHFGDTTKCYLYQLVMHSLVSNRKPDTAGVYCYYLCTNKAEDRQCVWWLSAIRADPNSSFGLLWWSQGGSCNGSHYIHVWDKRVRNRMCLPFVRKRKGFSGYLAYIWSRDHSSMQIRLAEASTGHFSLYPGKWVGLDWPWVASQHHLSFQIRWKSPLKIF